MWAPCPLECALTYMHTLHAHTQTGTGVDITVHKHINTQSEVMI